jgi:vitamin B12 transport system substrate-binding protein
MRHGMKRVLQLVIQRCSMLSVTTLPLKSGLLLAAALCSGGVLANQVLANQALTNQVASNRVAALPAQPPQRIIALAPHLVENLFSIGAGDRIVGTSAYADYPAAAKQIPQVSDYSGVQIEKVLALKPDLVLAWKSGTPAADVTRMQQLGLTVVVTDIDDLAQLASHLRQLGQLTGTSESANQLADDYQQQLVQLEQQYQQATPVDSFYELWGNPLTTAANRAWPAQQLALCGGRNVFADTLGDYPQIGLEQVLVRNPTLIIQPISATEKRQLVNWQQWPALKAVKHQHILQPNADALHRTTLRMLPALRQLCQQIDIVRSQSR